MKKLFIALFLVSNFLSAYAGFDYRSSVVEVYATAQSSPAKITIKWPSWDWTTGTYTVSRKLKSATTWGTPLTTKAVNTGSYLLNTYDDLTASVGVLYDYQVKYVGTTMMHGNTITTYGYISTGIEIPVVENRGGLILLVDDSFQTSLATEIARLQDDLEGDGWNVVTKYVSRTASVVSVKKVITDECTATPGIVSLFILGHVPVPYSGNQNPDGHPDHKGAWPTDTYYGDLDGSWTDTSVNNTSSSADGTRNDNSPGDGKFDQITVPTTGTGMELQVGRADLSNLPCFSTMTELQLTQKYLNKDHAYRKKTFEAGQRALVNAGWTQFATASWRNFSSLVEPQNVDTTSTLLPDMIAGSYKWAFAAGAGSFSSIGGTQGWDATTNTFWSNEVQGVFFLAFGSYFGDWDSQDNILRQPLGSGTTLASAWTGSYLWQFQHMAMGEPIGYSVKLSQNNDNTIFVGTDEPNPPVNINTPVKAIYMNLMGDPTLRNDIVMPVSNVTASFSSGNCTLNWTASSQSNLGYNVYVKAPGATTYVKANTTPIVGTSYVHTGNTVLGTYKYMVRTLILQTSCTGTYYNMSEGIIKTANLSSLIPDAAAPTTPTGLAKGTVTSTTVALSWNASVNAVGTTTYDVYKGGVLIAGSNTTNTTYTVTGLTPSTLYSFYVIAKDGFGSAAATAAVTATTSAPVVDNTAPTVPTGLSAASITSSGFTLNWTASTDAVGVVGYDVYQGATLIGSPTTNSYVVTGLTASTLYSFTVKAKDAKPNISAASAALSVTTLANAPAGAGIATWDLVGYKIAPKTGTISSAPVTTKDAGITVSNLTLEANRTNDDPGEVQANAIGFQNHSSATLAAAVANNAYIEFTITPVIGTKVSISSLDIHLFSMDGQENTFYLFSSKKGFGVANVIGSGVSTDYRVMGTYSVTDHNDLTTAVTFRIYISNTNPGGSNGSFAGIGNRSSGTADLTVNGVANSISTNLSGINETEFTLYPNPVLDRLSFNFSSSVDKAQVTILDLQGRSLLTKSIANTQLETLDVSSLNKGVYFVKVTSNGKVMNSKFVKK